MSQKQAKKMRKQLRFTAGETIGAFQEMVRNQSFKMRALLAWKILVKKI